MDTPPRHGSDGRPAYEPDATEASAHLSRLLALAARDPAHDEGDLRRAVRGFVRQLKAEGRPPEKVLVAVKTHVLRAIDPHQDDEAERALMSRSVEWCIAEYFRDD